jgi:hypothetical protein
VRRKEGKPELFPHVAPRYCVIQARQFDVVEDDEIGERSWLHDFIETDAAIVGGTGNDGSLRVGVLNHRHLN